MIRPKRPRIELKISMTRILTKLQHVSLESLWPGHSSYSEGSAASAKAALLPLMPTETPQTKLHMPTVKPAQNKANPV